MSLPALDLPQTVTVDLAPRFRKRGTVTVNFRYSGVWRIRARLWVATHLIRLATWIVQQKFELTEEAQP